MVEHIRGLEGIGWTIYPVNENLVFALSDKQVVMLTPLCSYMITCNQLNSKGGHARIRRGVLNSQYKSVAEVLTDMRLTPGVGVSYKQFDVRRLYV